jgi:GNAT superfamily N-acetyltransferase
METVLSGKNAFSDNSTRNMAKQMIKTTVTNGYFNHLWNTRNRRGDYSMWNSNGEFVGFAFVNKHTKPGSWKINLIGTTSGKGYGRLLMNTIKEDAKHNRKARFLRLNSVKPAIGFYQKQNFKTSLSRATSSSHYMSHRVQKKTTKSLLRKKK